MTQEATQPGPLEEGTGRTGLMVGFVYLNVYIIVHQINVTSRHFAVAFDIPAHNIGIYFTKVDSFRVLLMALGSGLEYLAYVGSSRSQQVRKYVSIAALGLLTATRLALLALLYCSRRLSLRAYVIFNADGLFCGFFQMGILSLAPQHTASSNLGAYVSGVYVFLVQRSLDFFLYRNPVLNLKIQCLLYLLTNLVAVGFWIHYTLYSGEVPTELSKGENAHTKEREEVAKAVQQKDQEKTVAGERNEGPKECTEGGGPGQNGDIGFLSHLLRAASPFMMFGTASLFKDFLYPGVLPYALLERDKCHAINMVVPIFFMLGPLAVYFLQSYSSDFKCWAWHYNLFWALAVPQLVVLACSLLAIHTRLASTRQLRNSQPRVLLMTLTLVICYNLLTPVSFVGVSNYVYYQSGYSESSLGVLTLHNMLSLVYRFLFTKLSVGYNDVRIATGYHLPLFRPAHRMSDWNTFWYLLRGTLAATGADIVLDFKMNIRKYI